MNGTTEGSDGWEDGGPDPAELQRRLDEALDELERLNLTLEVLGTVDLDTGLLNRNGLLEALERCRRWQARRGDVYGLLVVRVPWIAEMSASPTDEVDMAKHVAATIAAGLRDVDDVGRVKRDVFAGALSTMRPGSIRVVGERVAQLVATLDGQSSIGAIEVLSTRHISGPILDLGERLAKSAEPGACEYQSI